MSLHTFPREEVAKYVNHFRSASGTGEMRYMSMQKTDNPSIQGPWNQFTHKEPEKNLAKFPQVHYGFIRNCSKTFMHNFLLFINFS